LSHKKVHKWAEKRDKHFADDEEVETESAEVAETSMLPVSTHW
jgi:hypothetical protein